MCVCLCVIVWIFVWMCISFCECVWLFVYVCFCFVTSSLTAHNAQSTKYFFPLIIYDIYLIFLNYFHLTSVTWHCSAAPALLLLYVHNVVMLRNVYKRN